MSHQKGGEPRGSPPFSMHSRPRRFYIPPQLGPARLTTSALLPSLAHARQDAAAQRDGCLGGRITFWKSTQAASTKEYTSGQLPITLEATEEHGSKTRTIDNHYSKREITHSRAKIMKARRETHTLARKT